MGKENTGAIRCYNIGTIIAINSLAAHEAAGIIGSTGKVGVATDCYNLGKIISNNSYINNPIISYETSTEEINIVASNCYYLSDSDNDNVDGTTNKNITDIKALTINGFEGERQPSYGYPEITGNPQKLTDFAMYKVAVDTVGINGTVTPVTIYIKGGDNIYLNINPETGYYASVDKDGNPGVFVTTTNKMFTTPVNADTLITVSFIEREVIPKEQLIIEAGTEIHQYSVSEIQTVKNQDGIFTLEPGNKYGVTFAAVNNDMWGWSLVEYGVLFSITEEEPTILNSEAYKSLIPLTSEGKYGILFYGDNLVLGTYYTRAYATYKNNSDDSLYTVYNSVEQLVID